MSYDLELSLLEASKNSSRIELSKLTDKFHAGSTRTQSALKTLQDEGIVSINDGIIEILSFQRMMLAEFLMQRGRDPIKLSRWLRWQEFEDFATHLLQETGYRTLKHLVFKSEDGRHEIDLFAWSDTFVLSIDCKHWLHGLSSSRILLAVEAQVGRTRALARSHHVHLMRNLKLNGRRILPVLLTLSPVRDELVGGVPVVCVDKLLSFLGGVSPIDERLLMIPVNSNGKSMQARTATEGLI